MKISPYDFSGINDRLEQFRYEITNAWNYGKYPFAYATAGTPTWRAQPGENVLYRPASGGMSLYTYVQASAWLVLISATT